MGITILVAAGSAFTFFLLLTAIIFRVIHPLRTVPWIMTNYFISVFLLLILCVFVLNLPYAATGCSYVLFSLFVPLFIFGVYSAVESSVTMRLLWEISEGNRGVSGYTCDTIVRRRIDRFVSLGILQKINRDTYARGTRVNPFAIREKIIDGLRYLFPIS